MNNILLETQSTNKTTKSDTKSTQNKHKESKKSSSLFDSLLNEAKNNKQDKDHTDNSKKKEKKHQKDTNHKKDTDTLHIKNNLNNITLQSKLKLSQNNTIKSDKSLFDSLVDDVKMTSKKNDIETKKQTNLQSKKIVIGDIKEIVSKDKSEKTTKTKEEDDGEKKIDNQKTTLFDSLLKDIDNTKDDKSDNNIQKQSKKTSITQNNQEPKENLHIDFIDSTHKQSKDDKKSILAISDDTSKIVSQKTNKSEKAHINPLQSWTKDKTNKNTSKNTDKIQIKDTISNKQTIQTNPNLELKPTKNTHKSLLDSIVEDIKENQKNTDNSKDKVKKHHSTHDFLNQKITYSKETEHKRVVQSHIATGAKQVIYESKDTVGVKKASKILDLNLEKLSMIKSQDNDKQNTTVKEIKPLNNNPKSNNNLQINTQDKQDIVKSIGNKNKIMQNYKHEIDDNKSSNTVNNTIKDISHKKTIAQLNQKEPIEITVPINLMNDFKNKITTSRVQAGTFMSEIARKMVENYKPPQTAFRITLNPHNMGSIEVVIKKGNITTIDGKSTGLNINLNINNSSTHEMITTHQNDLRLSLNRNFANDNFNLNFTNNPIASNTKGDSSNHNSNQQEKNKQNKNQQKENKTSKTKEETDLVSVKSEIYL